VTIDRPGNVPDGQALRRDRLHALVARPHPDRVSSGLERVCRAAVDSLGLSAAVVSLIAPSADGRVGSEAIAASWGPGARTVEGLQLNLGEGPSRDAYVRRRPVLVSDLEQDLVWWPGYVPAALTAGIASAFAFPLSVGAVRLGVLTLYGAAARSLVEDDLADSLLLCEFATQLLLDQPVDELHDDTVLIEQLEFRDTVYQAQGMTMVALDVSLAEALARMRARAFAAGQDLTELATDILSGETTLSDAHRADEEHDDC